MGVKFKTLKGVLKLLAPSSAYSSAIPKTCIAEIKPFALNVKSVLPKHYIIQYTSRGMFCRHIYDEIDLRIGIAVWSKIDDKRVSEACNHFSTVS